VVGVEIISDVYDVLAAEVLGTDEIGVLHQRQEGKPGRFGQVEPVIPLGGELVT